MGKESKITMMLLALIFMGIIIFQVDQQRRMLKNIIESHERKMDSILNEYKDLNIHYDSILNNYDSVIHIIDSLPLGSPLDTLHISSNYGWRKSPFGQGWRKHAGVDFYAAWQDTVYATGSGIITMKRWNAGYGRCIVINHAWGYQSKYAHLYKYFVNIGDTVYKGQPIARAGNSGAVTGPHLHYEIKRNGKTADPTLFMLDI